jgi:hypothetical protein
MKQILRFLLVAVTVMPMILVSVSAQDLMQKRLAIGSGGFHNQATSTGGPSGALKMSGTIGQPVAEKQDAAGLLEGKRYDLYQGFWLPDLKPTTSVNDQPTAMNTDLVNYPNPFNNQTTIQFKVESPAYITVKIFDMAGNQIAELANSQMVSAGEHEVVWNAKNSNGMDASSGTYMYEVTVNTSGFAGPSGSNSYSMRNFMMLVK